MAGAVQPLEQKAIVLDAHPLTAWINGEGGAELIEALLESAARGQNRLLLSVVNAAEVLVVQERRGGANASHRTLDLLQELPIELVGVQLELAARAAYFKARGGISLADCFAAALAHRENIPLLTGDPELERVADVVEVLWFSPEGSAEAHDAWHAVKAAIEGQDPIDRAPLHDRHVKGVPGR